MGREGEEALVHQPADYGIDRLQGLGQRQFVVMAIDPEAGRWVDTVVMYGIAERRFILAEHNTADGSLQITQPGHLPPP